MELNTYTIAQLAAAYNEAIEVHDLQLTPVKRFKDKATAAERVQELADAYDLETWQREDGTLTLVTVDEAEAATEEPEGFDESEELEADEVAAEILASVEGSDEEIAVEPEPVKEKPAKKEAGLKKPRTEYEDRLRLEVRVQDNPKRKNSASYARFALYRDAMTVGEYLDACVALEGEKARPRYRYIADLAWDEERGFITVYTDEVIATFEEENPGSCDAYKPAEA